MVAVVSLSVRITEFRQVSEGRGRNTEKNFQQVAKNLRVQSSLVMPDLILHPEVISY